MGTRGAFGFRIDGKDKIPAPPRRFFAIDEAQIVSLRSVADRLFTENRLDGDGMRNLAQQITGVLDVVKNIPID